MKTQEKKQKSISKRSKRLIIFGFLFFVNPVPFGLDIIPDVFGCVLIFLGLTQLAYFDGNIEEARRSIVYLFAAEALHLVMMRSVFLTDIASNRLLAVTGFSIVQGILYVLFFKKLFSGVSYYAMRNNCNSALAASDGTAFLSYLAFFIRLGATLIPELIAILELQLNLELDFQTYDAITAVIAAKPILVVLFSAVALGVSVAWFVSVFRLFTTLHAEGGEQLDSRYASEYTSRPEKTRPKKVRIGCCAVYFALFFALDFSFDNIRVIPASAMFLFLFAAAFAFKGISGFDNTKKLAIPAFLLTLATEIYRMILVPDGAIVIYETELWIVAVGAVAGILTAVVCLLCIRGFFADIRRLSADLGGKEIKTETAWVFYCASSVLWAAGFIVPFFYPSVSAPRLISSVVFVILTVKILGNICENEYERQSLYGDV